MDNQGKQQEEEWSLPVPIAGRPDEKEGLWQGMHQRKPSRLNRSQAYSAKLAAIELKRKRRQQEELKTRMRGVFIDEYV